MSDSALKFTASAVFDSSVKINDTIVFDSSSVLNITPIKDTDLTSPGQDGLVKYVYDSSTASATYNEGTLAVTTKLQRGYEWRNLVNKITVNEHDILSTNEEAPGNITISSNISKYIAVVDSSVLSDRNITYFDASNFVQDRDKTYVIASATSDNTDNTGKSVPVSVMKSTNPTYYKIVFDSTVTDLLPVTVNLLFIPITNSSSLRLYNNDPSVGPV